MEANGLATIRLALNGVLARWLLGYQNRGDNHEADTDPRRHDEPTNGAS